MNSTAFVVVKDPAQRKRIADIYPQALAVMGPYLKTAKIPRDLTEKQRNLIMKGRGIPVPAFGRKFQY